MATATVRVSKPGKRQGRACETRPAIFISNDAAAHSISPLRAQFLRARLGSLSPALTAVTASLIWGDQTA